MTTHLGAAADRFRWLVAAVTLTLIPFLWKALEYTMIGSYVPLGAFVVLALISAAGLRFDWRWAIRIWCAAMITWGVARIVLGTLFVATDLSEAHLQSQVNVTFNLVSLAYILAGVAIWRRA